MCNGSPEVEMKRQVCAAAALTLFAAGIAPALAADQAAPQTGYAVSAGYPAQGVAADPSPVWSAPGQAPHYVLYGHYVGGGKWRQEWVLTP
jgi:hypothetical protein